MDAPPVQAAPRPQAAERARLRWLAAVAAYLACGAAVLAPIWSARVEPRWDGLDFNYPSFAYAAEVLRAGRLPLWDPFTNCGQPFISDPALLWYQPGAVLAAFLRSSPFDGYMLFWAATWLWAGLGAFVLAAVLRARPLGCFVAAVAFGMSGFFVGHGQQLPYVVTAAWLPWTVALAHLAVARERLVLALAAGAALGLSARGGYGGLVVFEGLALGLWLVLAFLLPGSGPAADDGRPPGRRARWIAVTLGSCAALLVVIWAPAIWAFLVEAAEFTDRRQPLPPEVVLRGNPFPLRAAITLAFPTLAVEHAPFFPTDVSMVDAYVGVLALPFAAAWVVAERRRALWLVLLAAFWLLASLGEAGGVRTALHHLVPPTRFMRHNGMIRVLFLLPLAVAAGCGVSRALDSGRTLARAAALVLLAALAVAAPLVGARFGWRPSTFFPVGVAAAGAALLLLPSRWTPRCVLGPALALLFAADLAWHVRANALLSWHAPPVPAPRVVEAAPDGDPLDARLTDPRYAITRLNLVERRPVVEGYVSLASARFARLKQGAFLEVLAAPGRYWLSPSARPAPPGDGELAEIAAAGAGDAVPVYVDEGLGGPPLPAEPVVPGTHGTVEVESYAAERVTLRVDVPGPGDALLASTERFAPSWEVRVDGERRPVAVVNTFFRGVRVPPGVHLVEFRYQPRPFLPLFVLSYVALAVVVVALLARYTKTARREGRALVSEVRAAGRVARDGPGRRRVG